MWYECVGVWVRGCTVPAPKPQIVAASERELCVYASVSVCLCIFVGSCVGVCACTCSPSPCPVDPLAPLPPPPYTKFHSPPRPGNKCFLGVLTNIFVGIFCSNMIRQSQKDLYDFQGIHKNEKIVEISQKFCGELMLVESNPTNVSLSYYFECVRCVTELMSHI